MKKNFKHFKEILDHWHIVASDDDRESQIRELFHNATNSDFTRSDILSSKNKIMEIWVPLTWNEAKKKYPNWKEKSWWIKRKDLVENLFNKIYKEFFYNIENGECTKTEPPKQERKTDKEYYKDIPVFTTIEEMMAYKAKRESLNGNG